MTSDPTLLRLLETLGFDVRAGMDYCGGDEAFYCDLIREFHAGALSRRVSALRDADPQARKDYAHMMKGTLRILGAEPAAAEAHAVELALRNGEPDGALAGTFLASLDAMHAAIGDALRR